MWNDKETDLDLLDFQHLTAGLLSIINDESLLPATIGVFGDWGSGKSSLLKMAHNELEKDENILCISFNGWLFEGYDDAKAALLETIIKEISDKKKLSPDAKDKVKRLLGKINWMRVVLTLGKYGAAYSLGGEGALTLSALPDIPELAKSIAGAFEGLNVDEVQEKLENFKKEGESSQVNVREFHEDFAELVELSKIDKLVVFIDDLDRCNPETIIETLEAIRLFLYAKNTVFILAADERLVKYAVTKKYPDIPGLYSNISRDYLEKLIQFPIVVPPLGRVEVETYMKLLFVSKISIAAENYENIRQQALNRCPEDLFNVTLSYADIEKVDATSSKDVEEDIALSEFLAPILSTGLDGNPRQIKRFLNTLLFRQSMANAKGITLATKVLAKLMLLEYLKPAFFRQLAVFQAIQNGKPEEIATVEENLTKPKSAKKEDNGKEKKAVKGSGQKDPEGEDTSATINLWLSDQWMIDWLQMEPQLGDIDLRPYFYFSRDTLSPQKELAGRLSPLAQEILTKLLSSSETFNRQGLDRIKTISQNEASSVFDTIASKIKTTEAQDERNQLLGSLVDIAEVRAELASQLLGFLGEQPANHIPISLPPKLKEIIKDPNLGESLETLVTKWAENQSNARLRKAAEIALKDSEGD